jgi:hypothetical protein
LTTEYWHTAYATKILPKTHGPTHAPKQTTIEFERITKTEVR